MTASPAPPVDFTQEIRFAVVMYGGISLAIYMNGIAQELLHLVRATAPSLTASGEAHTPQVAGTAAVYRELGRLLARGAPHADDGRTIRSRFVVDILAGTSAGGINAVYLARALANDEPLDRLQQLWVEEGDIARLINDAGAVSGLRISPADPPRAPLSGDRMYLKLLDAFEGMGGPPVAQRDPDERGALSPNVDELDLFVTATDVRGLRTTLTVADAQPEERRYGTVFNLRYRAIAADDLTGPVVLGGAEPAPLPPTQPDRNDFVAFNNPFLAFIARATSAHQATFQPMRLGDAIRLLGTLEGYRTLKWVDKGVVPERWEKLIPAEYRGPALAGAGSPFAERDFADGGVLDNKPFGYVLDSIPTRSRVRPVTRKLLFIDPAPERFVGTDTAEPPAFVENGLAALLTIRGYEPIRQDLERLERYNWQAARQRSREASFKVAQNLRELNAYDAATWEQIIAQRLTAKELRERSYYDLIRFHGRAWDAYMRDRMETTATLLARILARGAGITARSLLYAPLVAAVRAWANLRYAAADARRGPRIVPFLRDFDSDWHLRRLNHALDDLEALVDAPGERGDVLVSLARRYDEKLREVGALYAPTPATLSPGQQLAQLRRTLGVCYTRLQAARAHLVDEDGHGELARAIRTQALPDRLAALVFDRHTRDPQLLLDPQLPLDRQEAWFARAFGQPAGGSPAAPLRAALDLLILGQVAPAAASPADDARLLKAILTSPLEDPPNLRASHRVMLAASQAELYSLLAIVEQDDERPIPAPEADDGMPAVVARYSVLEFERYDEQLFPPTILSEVGDERSGVEVYRVSPYDAPSLIDERRSDPKLAGTTMGAFGAFFEREFRENDIMWGRLDGAERIIAALLPAAQDAALRLRLTAQAHDAILRETYYSTEERKGLLATLTTLEQRRDYFVQTYKAEQAERRKLNNYRLADSVARIGRVADKMFAAYGAANEDARPLTLWANRLLSLGASVLDVALARNLPAVFMRRLLPVIYFFALLQLIVGALAGSASVQSFGIVVGVATLAFHLLVLLAQDWLVRQKYWLQIARTLAIAFFILAALAAAVVVGVFITASSGPQGASELLSVMRQPTTIIQAAAILIGALALFGLFIAWWQYERASRKGR